MVTGFGTTEVAIEATKRGAFDYYTKPFESEALVQSVERALQSVRLMKRQVELDRGTTQPVGAAADVMIGQSPAMQRVCRAIGRVAETDATVLIRGETGTGKELVARAIYQHSLRQRAPLLVVNCAAIAESLLESELFGHEKGAFTHAVTQRIGKFEQAHGATIFLDEIGDSPPAVQVKLLRVLQERTLQRVGGNDTIEVDVRILAATNRNLESAIKGGRFREDLYYRLNVVTIDVPRLSERQADIPRLTDFFLDRFSSQLGLQKPQLATEAMEMLQDYPWPGNVRELEHCVQRAVIFTQGYSIQAADLCHVLGQSPETTIPSESRSIEDQQLAVVRRHLESREGPGSHAEFLELVDKLLVVEALRKAQDSQTQAAKVLGINRTTLQAKMRKYGIPRHSAASTD